MRFFLALNDAMPDAVLYIKGKNKMHHNITTKHQGLEHNKQLGFTRLFCKYMNIL